MVNINILNAGNMTLTTGHPETRFTLEGGTVETYNITGTLDQQWMFDNGYSDNNWNWKKKVIEADIGNTVTRLGYAAFAGCMSLTSITISNSVTSIEGEAFAFCDGL